MIKGNLKGFSDIY